MSKKNKAIIAEDVKRVQFTIEEGVQMVDELEERMKIVEGKIKAIKTEINEVLLLVPETEWLRKMIVQNCTKELFDRSAKLRDIEFTEIEWELRDKVNSVSEVFTDLREMIFNSYFDEKNDKYWKN